MKAHSCAAAVALVLSVLGGARLDAQGSFPLRGEFARHEVVISVSGTCVAGSTTESVLTSASASVPLPALECPGKAALQGSLQLNFPAQTAPAAWLKNGLFGVAFGFQGGITPSIAGQGSWQITPGAPPDARQNGARVRSAAALMELAGVSDQDVSLADGARPGDSIALEASDERLVGNIENLNKVASWDGERVSGYLPSTFWTVVESGGSDLARVLVSVKSWYTFTSGQPLKDHMFGYRPIPRAPWSWREGRPHNSRRRCCITWSARMRQRSTWRSRTRWRRNFSFRAPRSPYLF